VPKDEPLEDAGKGFRFPQGWGSVAPFASRVGGATDDGYRGGSAPAQHAGDTYQTDPHPGRYAGPGDGRFQVPPGRVADGTDVSGRYVPWSSKFREPAGFESRYTDKPDSVPIQSYDGAPRQNPVGPPPDDYFRGHPQFRKPVNNPLISPILRQDEQTDSIYKQALRASKSQTVETLDELPKEVIDLPQIGEANAKGVAWGRENGEGVRDPGPPVVLNAPQNARATH
jgi:hypothetical protein